MFPPKYRSDDSSKYQVGALEEKNVKLFRSNVTTVSVSANSGVRLRDFACVWRTPKSPYLVDRILSRMLLLFKVASPSLHRRLFQHGDYGKK